MVATSLRARFLKKCSYDASGCLLWTAYVDLQGYGRFKQGRVMRNAHRVGYEIFVGPVPDGLLLDHLCRVRRCVNPHHLEPVTSRENTLRGATLAAEQVARTHCPQGHPYDAINTYLSNGGKRRHCRSCMRARKAAA